MSMSFSGKTKSIPAYCCLCECVSRTRRRSRLGFQTVDLFNAPGMATTLELGLQPDLDPAIDEPVAEQVGRQTQYVRIVMPAAHFGGKVVVASARPHSRKL